MSGKTLIKSTNLPKKFSILGDSISTLSGYNPRGYNVFYEGEVCKKSGVLEMKDTWWGKVIEHFGGELLVNNSWSGSRVTKVPGREGLFPSGCSDERTSGLHVNSVRPDVIIVYLGTNDWAFGATTDYIDYLQEELTPYAEAFAWAYEDMLFKLKMNYPNAEIWCCTLSESFMASKPGFVFPHTYGGEHIEVYNDIIRDAVSNCRCRLVDLYRHHKPYDSLDGSHPTADGMNTLATVTIREMEEVEEMETKNLSEIPVSEVEDTATEEFEYVMIDPDITTNLFSDTIRLTVESTGKSVQLQGQEVKTGRHQQCEFMFDAKHARISRIHAIFSFEKGIWFVRDNNSANGTWLNGARMQPGKKYQLLANDVIDFANCEKLIFEKKDGIILDTEPEQGDEAAKAVEFLESSISILAETDYKDEVAWKLVVAALTKAPLYLPVEIDIAAMLGNVDPMQLKPGDVIQPQDNVKVKILTTILKDGTEFIPMFTSEEEIRKGPAACVLRYYPQDYLPMLLLLDKPVIINPFGACKFLIAQALIKDVLLPIVQEKEGTKAETPVDKIEDFIGTVIDDKYKVVECLAKRMYTTVFRAVDIRLNRSFAIKVCDKRCIQVSKGIWDEMQGEITKMKNLNHPAIPQIIDIIESKYYTFIVMDLVDGVTLDCIMKQQGAQSAEKVMNWGIQLCEALHYLHTMTPPRIHRDVKPSNIMLTKDGRIKLIDFGIMRTYGAEKKCDTAVLGTRGYAAPEQYGGCGQTDARTDIFGLGATMHYLVTGIDPISDSSFIPIRKVNRVLPRALEDIISKCLQPSADKRYQTCEEVLNALKEAESSCKSGGILSKIFGGK